MIPILAIVGVIVIGWYLVHMATGSSNSPAVQIARAIGVAEGGYDANGNNLQNSTLPSRNHNPGDLTVDVSGKGTGSNGGFVVYGSDSDGWDALEQQVGEWLN